MGARGRIGIPGSRGGTGSTGAAGANGANGTNGADGRVMEFRLSLLTADPAPAADQLAKATLYLTPYRGNQISIYDTGTATWIVRTSAEVSTSLAALANGTNYDVFITWTGSALGWQLEAWTNDTTRAVTLTRQDGTWVATGSAGRRYVGTIRASAAGQCEESAAKRFVWNAYNRVPRAMLKSETTSWAYTTAVYRSANANDANRLQFVLGLQEEPVNARARCQGTNATNSSHAVGIALDATNTNDGTQFGSFWGGWGETECVYRKPVAVGFHFLQWTEICQAAGTMTWGEGFGAGYYGDAAIEGEVWA